MTAGETGAPLRVAQVMGQMDSGGVEAVVMNLYRAMDRARVQFDFFLHEGSAFPQREELLSLGARFFFIPHYSRPVAYVRALRRLLSAGGYSIVHAQISTMSVLPLFAAWLAGVPVRICHNHSTAHAGEGKKTLLKKLLRHFSRLFATDLFACGDFAARWMYGDRLVDAGRVTVLKNAVDGDRYRFDPAGRQALREELAIAETTFALGHVGRFTYAKNHMQLLEIYAALHGRRPDSVLLLAGEGELLPAVRERAAALGLSESVRFLGVRQDADRLYSAMDAFCLPSFYEGLPVVGVELQWNGLPACLSDQVTREAFVNANVRRIALADAPGTWAETLLSLPRCAPAAGMAAFDIHAQAQRLAAFYLARAAGEASPAHSV